MLIPLYDDTPMRRITRPYVNWALIAVNVFVYAVFQSGQILDAQLADAASPSFGMIPVVLFHEMDLPAEYAVIPQWLTLVTSSFLHGSWMHLAGNMLFLWVFGDNVEDDLGHARYLFFYLACAVLAGLTHAFMQPHSTSPLIGASGAVSGVVAAYVLLHPRVKIWVLVLFRIPLRMRAMWAIGAWIVFQAVNALLAASEDDTAWFAHLGGLLAGGVLTLVLKRPDTPLFDQEDASPLIMETAPPDPEPPGGIPPFPRNPG